MSDTSTRTIVRPRNRASGVQVTVVAGPGAGAAVAGRKVAVGRSPIADLVVADPTVSEFHVEASPGDGGVEVKDLDSWNGTYFGGAWVGHAVLPTGATLVLGQSAIRVDLVNEPERPRPSRDSFRALLGRSAVMRELFALLARLAPTDLSVLVEGPTGSGKELVARALHDESTRTAGPFVVLDAAALPPSLAESVLFGHVEGAFTGAVASRAGAFEAAHGGTVFIDEVGELPLDLQPKLLRVLERREVVRLGENRPRPAAVRVIAATWRDLRRMVNQGQFRDDLYYRLAQARVVLPPLKERREDIELLVAEILRRLPRSAACARAISPDALAQLSTRDYPGNVRELKNTVERAAYMCDGPVIRSQDLAFERLLERGREPSGPTAIAGAEDEESTVPEFKEAKRTAVDDFEQAYLARLMAKTGGNLTTAASRAGIERHYLRTLLKKHGLRTARE